MAAVFDIADMKQRVAATQSKLSESAQDKRERGAHFMTVLAAAEKTLAHNQQHIDRLEREQDRTLDDVTRLRRLLHDMENARRLRLWRCFHPKAVTARAEAIERLDAIIAGLSRDDDAEAGPAASTQLAAATAPQSPGKAPADRGFLGPLIVRALIALLGLVGSQLALALFTHRVNSSLPLHLVVRRKTPPRWGRPHGRGS